MSRARLAASAGPALLLALAACADTPAPTSPVRHPGAAGRATAAPAAAGPAIAFTSYRDGNGEIYVMHPDGSGQTRLTNDPGTDLSPVWSPDGSKIAFARFTNGYADIFVMNADGTGVTQLTTEPGSDDQPAWSPDGSKIAFHHSPVGSAASDLYVMDANGAGRTRLTNTADVYERYPRWSPDGSRILYSHFTSAPSGSVVDLWTMRADGTDHKQLTSGGGGETQASWSPDGSRIVYTGPAANAFDDAIWVMNADGTARTRLTSLPTTASMARWSGDGTRITFAAGGDGAWQVYVMNADGTGVGAVTTESRNLYPAWRPGGVVAPKPQAVAFTSAAPNPGLVGNTYAATASGGASGNPVVLSSLTPGVCAVGASAGNAATVSLQAAGTCTVAADQAGGNGYSAAPQVTQTFTVARRTQSIAFTSTPPAPALLGGSYAVTAVGGGSGNPVVLTSLTPAVCTLPAGATSGAAVRFVATGTCEVAADQAGDAAHDAAARAVQAIAVRFAFGGFAAPIDNAPVVNAVRAGRGIPVRFSLGGDRGLAIFRPGFPRFVSAPCGTADQQAPVEVTTDSPSGLSYDATTGTYTYVWKSDAALGGRCGRLELGLVDLSDQGALFRFTR